MLGALLDKIPENPNISPWLIEVRKHFWGGLSLGGLISGEHFVLMSDYQGVKIHCYISRENLLVLGHRSLHLGSLHPEGACLGKY